MEMVDIADVRTALGLTCSSAGTSSLIALALLGGGDYDPAGAKRVGSKLAQRVVRRLLRAVGLCNRRLIGRHGLTTLL